MDTNDTMQLHQSATMNDIFISEIDEAFSVFASIYDSVSVDSTDSADTILKEFVENVENIENNEN